MSLARLSDGLVDFFNEGAVPKIDRQHLRSEQQLNNFLTLVFRHGRLLSKPRARPCRLFLHANKERAEFFPEPHQPARYGACGSGMTIIGSDKSGPRIRSRYKESGTCSNQARYYVEKIASLVLERLGA